jgi:hypothetical protein
LRRPYRSSRPLAARLSARLWKPPPTEMRNEYIPRIVCLSSIVRTPCLRTGLGTDRFAMAPAYDLVVRSVSAGVALYARPRSKMASEAWARRRVRKLGAAQAQL